VNAINTYSLRDILKLLLTHVGYVERELPLNLLIGAI
jgi:hypothetical protein